MKVPNRVRRVPLGGPLLFVLTACAVALGAAPAGAAPALLVDDTATDFAAATHTSATWVTEPGSVRLRPPVLSEGFDDAGPDLPASLTSVAWNATPGSATVGSGSLTVDGVRVHPPDPPQSEAPQVLEFRATFADAAFQHIGFGDTFNNPPWAMFSTGNGTGLSVRTSAVGGPAINEAIATDPLVPHLYRIEWAPTEVRFFVDDALVATHAIAIATPMRPVVSDFTDGSGVLKLDWLGTGAYSTPGVFESRIHDAGDARAVWSALAATSSGGSVDMETRAGNVPTPDGTWSAWEPLGTAGAIVSPIGRYIQYRATLSPSSGRSPSLDQVEIGYEVDTVAPVAVIDGVDVAGAIATVRFSSADADVDRFECRLGAAVALLTCTSPKEFAGLVSGSYTVFVRAVDEAGNVSSVVERQFVVADPPASGGGQGSAPPPSVADPDPGVVVDKTSPAVQLLTRSARATAAGLVAVRVRCPGDEIRCLVTVRVQHKRTSSRRKTVKVEGGRRATVRLRLPSATRSVVLARGGLKVTAIVTARDLAGNRKTVKRKLMLLPPSA
jgi:hypothetical protein